LDISAPGVRPPHSGVARLPAYCRDPLPGRRQSRPQKRGIFTSTFCQVIGYFTRFFGACTYSFPYYLLLYKIIWYFLYILDIVWWLTRKFNIITFIICFLYTITWWVQQNYQRGFTLLKRLLLCQDINLLFLPIETKCKG
jgi:hypothetical protein